ncbi:MAG: TolC family protein [Arcobacteraceae bacterium]
MKNKLLILCIVSVNSLYANVLYPSQAYTLALENANTIKSSTLQIDAKKEDLNQWSSKYYPQVDFTVDYNTFDYETNNNASYNPGTNELERSLDYTLALRQSIYNHETTTKIALERKRVYLSEVQLQREKQELSQEVFKAYMIALNSQNKIDLLKAYLGHNEQKLEAIQKRYKLTISSKMDLLESKVEVSRSKIDLIKEEKLLKTYLLKLKQLTNLEDIQLPKIDFENFEISSLINDDDLSQDADTYLENNLEYIQSNETIKLLNLEIQNAKSGHYPTLDFDARYTLFDSDSETTDYENSLRWSIKLNIPLYSGGYTSSRVTSSQINQKASYEDLEVVKKDLSLRYDELLSLLNTSIRSVDVYKEALISSKSYLDFILQGYDNGLKSSIDLYDAKSKVFEIKYEYTKNIQEFIQVYVDYLILNNDIEKLSQIDDIIKKS